jgi:hypothetical protein
MGQGKTPWRVYGYAMIALVMAAVIAVACMVAVGDLIVNVLGPLFGIPVLFFAVAFVGMIGMFPMTYLLFVRGKVPGMTFMGSVQHPEHRVFHAYFGNLPWAMAGILLLVGLGKAHYELGNMPIALSTIVVNVVLAGYAIWRAVCGAQAVHVAIDTSRSP